MNDCSTPTISFLYTCVLLYSYFAGKRGDAGRVPQIWDRETNASCPQILTYTQAIRDQNRSRQWSSKGQKIVQKSICAGAPPWTPLGRLQHSHRPLAGGEWLAAPSPRTPPSFGPAGLGSPFALPWKKNPAGAHDEDRYKAIQVVCICILREVDVTR